MVSDGGFLARFYVKKMRLSSKMAQLIAKKLFASDSVLH